MLGTEDDTGDLKCQVLIPLILLAPRCILKPDAPGTRCSNAPRRLFRREHPFRPDEFPLDYPQYRPRSFDFRLCSTKGPG